MPTNPKKRPASEKSVEPPAKQQKGAAKAAGEKAKKEAPAAKESAAKAAAPTPSTPGSAKKEIPGDVKAKVRQILAGQAAGIKGADFPREWQKAHGTAFKDAIMKLGFKKQGEFMSALTDVVEAK